MRNKYNLNRKSGFTLIELLIVIAILGTLAVVVLLALNPAQQLARTRDAGRISAITQLGHALEAFSTTRSGYPPVAGGGALCGTATNWLDCLVTAGEIQVKPAAVGAVTCGTQGNQNNWCYNVGTVNTLPAMVIYAKMESQAQNSRCSANQVAWAAYSSVDGKGGILCTANANTPPTVQTQAFLP